MRVSFLHRRTGGQRRFAVDGVIALKGTDGIGSVVPLRESAVSVPRTELTDVISGDDQWGSGGLVSSQPTH